VVLAIPVLLMRFDLFGAFCLSIGLSISGAELSTGLTLLSQSVTLDLVPTEKVDDLL
jgi:hypothetical protein